MIRYIFVIVINLLLIPYFIFRAEHMIRHIDQYSFAQRYAFDMKVIRVIQVTGGIKTHVFGEENLPREGGYVMFANHQGKYDALGIMYSHKSPCSVVMDEKKSHMVVVKQYLDLVDGKRLEKDNVRQAMKIIYEIADEVKQGKRYLIFPAGGYERNNKNRVEPFKAGSFKAAMGAKAPIVPVAIIDSYKAFETNAIGRVNTQVHFLKPILYEEYKNLKAVQIAKIVEQRIKDCIVTYE